MSKNYLSQIPLFWYLNSILSCFFCFFFVSCLFLFLLNCSSSFFSILSFDKLGNTCIMCSSPVVSLSVLKLHCKCNLTLSVHAVLRLFFIPPFHWNYWFLWSQTFLLNASYQASFNKFFRTLRSSHHLNCITIQSYSISCVITYYPVWNFLFYFW